MTDIFNLDGRHALITGASGGLGAHFAALLAKAGARVTLAARRSDALALLEGQLRKQGFQAQSCVLDVANPRSIEQAFGQAEEAFGVVDILINNAGVTATNKALELELSDFDPIMEVNLKGAWLVAQKTAQRLVAAGKPGTIVNIASILGERVAGGVLAYTISKAGLVQMTKALALEWARHEIRVNALAPGYIETDINRDFMASDAGKRILLKVPQRRLGQMGDLDGPLLLLASDASRFMTGSIVPVDGGHLVSSL